VPLDQIARCRGELNVDIEFDSEFGDRCSPDRSCRLSTFAIYARAEAKGPFGIISFAAYRVCYAVRRVDILKGALAAFYLGRASTPLSSLGTDAVHEHFENGFM
jgi:hypothetical protein